MLPSSEPRLAVSDDQADLVRDQRGAMFLMCIPICFFMIGLLYFVIGLGESLILRERMQDAADAGALSAAIVHARGMNLLALLNQVMAAMVGLLIMVRLLEVLLMAAIAIATALAYFTGGSSLSIVPACEAGREEAHNAWEGLKEIVEPVVEIIHAIEIGVQYGMPVIAEARVLTMVPKYEPVAAFGFAIPGNFPLPVTNGTWQELCEHGGHSAGGLLSFPITKLIPVKAVSDVISDGIAALTGTFSDTFCGHGGTGGNVQDKMTIPTQLPDVKISREVQKNYPVLKWTKDCSSPTPAAEGLGDPVIVRDGASPVPRMEQPPGREETLHGIKEDKERLCEDAAQHESRAKPDEQTGKPSTVCNYKWPNENDVRSCSACVNSPTQDPPCIEWQQKIEGAGTECMPSAVSMKDWHYVQHNLSWTAELTAAPGCGNDLNQCLFTLEFKETKPSHTSVYVAHASANPCGQGGTVGQEWRHNTYHADDDYELSEYLCEEPHTAVEPSMFQAKGAQSLAEWRKLFNTTIAQKGGDPQNPDAVVMVINNNASQSHWMEYWSEFSSPPPPPNFDPDAGMTWPPADQPPNVPGQHITFTGTWAAVAYMHSCEQMLSNFKDSAEWREQVGQVSADEAPTEVTGIDDACSEEGESDNVHMKMEPITKDNVLGGEDYQMRVIAIRKGKSSKARDVVRNIPLRRRSDESNEKPEPLGVVSKVLGRIFAAQAEYFYDAKYKGPKDGAKQNDEGGSKENEKLEDHVDEDRGEWTWNMKWKARIRRLRFMPEGEDDDEEESESPAGCDTGSPSPDLNASFQKGQGESNGEGGGEDSPGSGDGALKMLKTIEDVIVH